MSDFKRSIFEKFGGKCAYCGNEITINNMTIDHVIPRSEGGSNSYLNCFPSCSRCNSIKANGTIEEMRDSIIYSVQKLKTDRNFQMARKYKMISSLSEEVTFYFEEVSKEA